MINWQNLGSGYSIDNHMASGESEKSKISGAYALLLKEIQETLKFAHPLFASVEVCDSNKPELIRKFHMMKGGAGFFGLKDISIIAGKMEKTLQGELNKKSLENLGKDAVELDSLLQVALKT